MTSSRERFCLKHFHSLITNGRQLTWFLSICWEKNELKILIGDVSTWSCRKMKFRLRRIKKDETRPGWYKFTARNDVVTHKTENRKRESKNFKLKQKWNVINLLWEVVLQAHYHDKVPDSNSCLVLLFICKLVLARVAIRVGSARREFIFGKIMIVYLNLTHSLNCSATTTGPWNGLSITLFKWLMIASLWLDGLMNGGK